MASAGTGSRIPTSLQAVFLASNRGNEVHVAPPRKAAFRVFVRNILPWNSNDNAANDVYPQKNNTTKSSSASKKKNKSSPWSLTGSKQSKNKSKAKSVAIEKNSKKKSAPTPTKSVGKTSTGKVQKAVAGATGKSDGLDSSPKVCFIVNERISFNTMFIIYLYLTVVCFFVTFFLNRRRCHHKNI
jgi:hypothetical protein